MATIYTGLTHEEVISSRKLHGSNKLEQKSDHQFLKVLKDVALEPLFLILVGVSLIYFLLNQPKEGSLMIAALAIVSGISVFQEKKSRNAVAALQKLNSPKAKVFRAGELLEINSEELVVGDVFTLEDGNIIPADAWALELHDFSVNESILTGESLPVFKSLEPAKSRLFQGTLVMTGSCIATVTQVGPLSELGKIGQAIQATKTIKTPLQIQIGGFVKNLMIAGFLAFVLVFGVNYFLSKDLLHALLHGLTLAMSVIPEEIPVALSTFMALGAYRLYKKKVIVRSPHTVETLGAATVICADKTGTLTENKMELSAIFDFTRRELFDFTKQKPVYCEALAYGVWASEVSPFDPMEKALHQLYETVAPTDQRLQMEMVHEYPLSGDPPIMTHVYRQTNGERIIAVKGSVEALLHQSNLNPDEKELILEHVHNLAGKGYRLLGVGSAKHIIQSLPFTQQEFQFDFLGLLAFYDPPKKNISAILKSFYQAGIEVKMITGDHTQTALAIAKQIELKEGKGILTGAAVMALKPEELDEQVKQVNVFSRMFPEAKLRIIESLQRGKHIVAMTGDGVNDGPALKAAHIGIAMGERGSELARTTAALVLVDDDLFHLTEAVALGRRIFENLKKAIRYILSIHIPIILIVCIPFLFFDSGFEIFTPVHVIFLELIMGPTCSIIFENEPIEKNAMFKKPRKMDAAFFSKAELGLSILQGLVITSACFGIGVYFSSMGASSELIRTLIFTTLILSNMFLTLANRSFEDSIIVTIRYQNKLVPFILFLSFIFLLLSVYVIPIQKIFHFVALDWRQFACCLLFSFVGVIWLEIYKWFRRKKPIDLF